MILRSIHVPIFAGLIDRRFELTNGLNTLLGPNESGKSTLVEALSASLLLPTKLPKRRFAETMQRFLPIGGGDTVGVELEFESEGRQFRLEKRWGAGARAMLSLPTGGSIEDDDEVTRRLRSLLPASPATVEELFVSRQSRLGETLRRLDGHPEIGRDLAETLRTAVFESSAVSVERFRQIIDEEKSSHYLRWDKSKEMPERGRGVDNPWKRPGLLADAWYERERARTRVAEVGRIERSTERLNEEIADADRRIDETRRFLERNAQAIRGAERVSSLESELRALKFMVGQEREAFEQWPRLEAESSEIERELGELKPRVVIERSNLDRANEAARVESATERLRRVDSLMQEIQSLKGKLPITPIDDAGIEKLRSKGTAFADARRAVAAGRVEITFTSYDNTRIDVAVDGEKRVLDVDALLGARVSGEGLISICHGELEMLIGAVEGDPAELQDRYEHAQAELERELGSHGANDLAEAETTYSRCRSIVSQIDARQAQLVRELAGKTPEEIAESADNSVVSELTVEEATRRLVATEARIQRIDSRTRDIDASIASLERKYGDRDSLFDALTQSATRLDRLEAEQSSAFELPEGFSSGQELLLASEQAARRLDEQKDERHRLAMRRAAEESVPESLEMAEERLRTTEAEFAITKRKAEAIERISAATEKVLADRDRGLFADIEASFTDMLSRLARSRYRGADDWNSIPRALVRNDGEAISFGHLSGGTKDLFALAIRLSIADYYLSKSEGFLMLDDPFAELDPDRASEAAVLLESMAERHQLIVLTCHPEHADLFGPNTLHHL